MESIPVLPITSLIHLNVTLPEGMERFRRGLMAHVARGTLDGMQTKHLHELAVAIRDDAPKPKGTGRMAAALAKAFTPDPEEETPGGGGISPSAGE